MNQYTHEGQREGTGRQSELTGREKLMARQGDGSWPRLPTELAGREDTIALGGLSIELTMAAVFRGIPDARTVG